MASTTLAITVRDQNITTAESFNAGGNLDPVPVAFLEHDAQQCGFCTPGMMISAFELLSRVPDPSDEEIKEALRGNLCRCTGYVKPLEAVRVAADRMREAADG